MHIVDEPTAALRHSLRLTGHASLRIQQRGIPPWFLRLLIEQGTTTNDGHGAMVKASPKGLGGACTVCYLTASTSKQSAISTSTPL